ncbi:MAG: exodeoxyribonuclease VII large subunit [Bacilli bacterium]|nr:exodeoxyribonuclease VII large subunit [Bacilli bacterium]
MPIERPVYSVTDINRYVKAVLSNDENLKFIFVKGELSNFKYGANGHLYFSLKDKDCIINAAMFATYANRISFSPKNGDEIVVMASVDVYPARGTYQLIVYEMNPVGQGQQLVELEKLKKQLQSEGLFDVSRKRELNIYPRAIGVITAPNGAAIKDIITNVKRRYPICDIYVFPSSVQGENAPKELLKAFYKSQEYDLDTLIIGRGGGASEDLSAFNDEKLVRAIAESKMPVIAAVGHEIDSTLVDYVADKRASTPTGAAELATVDRREIEQRFQYAIDDMKASIYDRLDEMKENISSYKEDLVDELRNKCERISLEINSYNNQLEALNPLKVLERGYAIVTDSEGKAISSLEDIKQGDKIKTKMKDGTITAIVEEKESK